MLILLNKDPIFIIYDYCFQGEFTFWHSTVEKQALCLLSCEEESGLIISNPEQNVFLFLDRLNLQVSADYIHFNHSV